MLRAPKSSWFYSGPQKQDADWRIRYHGTAGFTLQSGQTTFVLDPFVTRPNLIETGFARLRPNEELVRRIFPRADAVLVGHAHHDHILDAPVLCQQTGADFVGSPDAIHVARAAGVNEEKLISTTGDPFHLHGAHIRGVPSRHGRVYGRVPLPGGITKPPPWPPRLWDLRHGLVLNWHVQLNGLNIVHIDSADLIDEEFAGMQADVVCLCAIGRQHRPNYLQSVVSALNPKWIIPCHWDWFFTPYEKQARLLPGVNLPGFVQEIADHGVEPILLPFEGEFQLSHSDLSK